MRVYIRVYYGGDEDKKMGRGGEVFICVSFVCIMGGR